MPDIFVQRQFDLDGQAVVVLRIFRPEFEHLNACYCAYSISWPDRERNSRGYGVDEIQALLLTLQMAHVELQTSPEGRAGRLRWLGEVDLGMPLA